MKILLTLIPLGLVAIATLRAQSGQPERLQGAERACSFQVVLLSHVTHELHYRDRTGDVHMLLPPTRTRTPIQHNYAGRSPLRFFDYIPNDEGEMVERTLAQVAFPSELHNLLILLQPADDSWQRVRSFVLDDAVETFPRNTVRVLNASQYMLACDIDGRQSLVAPNQEVQSALEEGSTFVSWRIAAKIDDEWRLVRASSSQFLPGMRQLIVVNVDVSGDQPSLDILSLRDRPRSVD